MKSGSYTAKSVGAGTPVAMLHQQGKFLPGEHAEQWRGEGACQPIDLGDVLDLIPHFTVTSMVASSRIANEKASAEQQAKEHEGVSEGRLAMQSKSHVTEVMQKTRIELENGDISMNELKECIAAFPVPTQPHGVHAGRPRYGHVGSLGVAARPVRRWMPRSRLFGPTPNTWCPISLYFK